MGHERGFVTMAGIAATVSRSLGEETRGPAATRCKPSSSGLSRMKTKQAVASARVTTPMPTNDRRQPMASTMTASGPVPTSAPKAPMLWLEPATVANSCGRNHSDARRSEAISMTDAPTPTRSRPAKATPNVGAAPNSTLPADIVTPPSARRRRGPSVSDRVPFGRAITTKQ